MTKYELALVVNAKLEDEERLATVEKAKEYITRFGGVITNVDDWGKKRLAYEIQKMKEGFYYFIQFDAETSAPAEIEKHVRIMENVIRYLCVKQEAQDPDRRRRFNEQSNLNGASDKRPGSKIFSGRERKRSCTFFPGC